MKTVAALMHVLMHLLHYNLHASLYIVKFNGIASVGLNLSSNINPIQRGKKPYQVSSAFIVKF